MFIFAIFMDSQQHNGLYRARLLCEIHLNISDQCIVLHKGPADGFVSLILGFRRDSQKSNFKIKFSILSSRLADALMILWLLAISRYKHLPGPHTRHNFPHYQTLGTAGQYWPRPAVRLSSLQCCSHPYSSENIILSQVPVCSSLCSNFQWTGAERGNLLHQHCLHFLHSCKHWSSLSFKF